MQYYLFHGQKRHGPFTLDQITSQLLPPDAMVWRQGLSGWVPPHDVPELRDELPPPDPESTEVPVSAVAVKANVVPAASVPVVAIRPSQAPGHGSRATAHNSPARSAAVPAIVVPDQKSSIAKPTKVKEWWVVVTTIAIACVMVLVLSVAVQATAFVASGTAFTFVVWLCCLALYPVVKAVLCKCIDG